MISKSPRLLTQVVCSISVITKAVLEEGTGTMPRNHDLKSWKPGLTHDFHSARLPGGSTAGGPVTCALARDSVSDPSGLCLG